MTATFEAKVTVLERVTDELIRFRAAGKSVRGAIGNVCAPRTRSGSAAPPTGPASLVEGDLVLAGALGSVGQKVVARQAAKVTAEFATNLQRALNGELVPPAQAGPGRSRVRGPADRRRPSRGPVAAGSARPPAGPAGPAGPADRWSKAAAALSGVSVALSVIILIRQRRGQMTSTDSDDRTARPARAERRRHRRGERVSRDRAGAEPG